MKKGVNSITPDFPAVGGTPASIWAYASRTLTALTGQPRTDLVGANESIDTHGYTSVRAGLLDNLDAAISTRSSHSAADVWAVVARTLTAFTGQPRTDLLGENADFEAGTGTRKARLDIIPAFETATEGSVTMDGTEQIIVTKTDSKMGLLDGMLDLTPMLTGDTLVVRQYMKISAGAAFAKYAEETYAGAQSIPLLYVTTKTNKNDIKVTVEQTASAGAGWIDVWYSFNRRKQT